MNIYSCESHINRALDEYVANEGTFPAMEPVKKDVKLSTTCSYCDQVPIYIVTNVQSDTTSS
ncbi:CxxH/CxxC protein [Sporosarcina koreensis]|uniref:CxxH/CxxC protein n=1 Tax=Sporosarcina koreensis TaxID=334735 RepID=UPI0009E1ADC2|nr:CxxH/CxxC protein [Sporosarcina koreensis]